jgi:ATP-dependent Clp protease ATP-binding subunit ClpC
LTDIVDVLQPAFCELRFPGRPVVSMLFLGPTGTGETETAELFTRHLFGSADKLVRIDSRKSWQ